MLRLIRFCFFLYLQHLLIKQLNHEHMSILLIEQNAQQALKIADRGYVLENGRITMTGKGAELLNNEEVKTAYLGL